MAFYAAHKRNMKEKKAIAKLKLRTFGDEKDVLLVRDLLSPQEQYDLVDAVIKAEQQCKSIKLINKNPNSDTIMVINPSNAYQSKYRSSPIYYAIFAKTLQIISDSKIKTKLPGIQHLNELKIDRIKGLEYNVIGGKIESHCDGRKGYVMIFSLGNTANFNVQAPKMKRKKAFEFRNGDCLIFDTSKEVNIIHEITSIQPNSCDVSLAAKYPRFRQSRICVMFGYR